MKPATTNPKHETLLKHLRHERNAENQHLFKLKLKVVEKLTKSAETRAA